MIQLEPSTFLLPTLTVLNIVNTRRDVYSGLYVRFVNLAMSKGKLATPASNGTKRLQPIGDNDEIQMKIKDLKKQTLLQEYNVLVLPIHIRHRCNKKAEDPEKPHHKLRRKWSSLAGKTTSIRRASLHVAPGISTHSPTLIST